MVLVSAGPSSLEDGLAGQPFRLWQPFFPFSFQEIRDFESTIFEENLYNFYTELERTYGQVTRSIRAIDEGFRGSEPV